jgi:hypothetical protein
LLEKICRQRGGAAWFRQWTNNYHVHTLVIGTPGFNSVCRQQVAAYKAGRDGMVSNNRVGGIIITTFEKWKGSVSQVVTGVAQAVSNAARVNSLQKAVRRTATGVWDEQTDIDLRNTQATAKEGYTGHYFNRWSKEQKVRMQKTWGAYQDGIWGFATKSQAKAATVSIQRALGVTADGIWGNQTEAAYNALRAKMYKKTAAAPAKPAPKPAAKPQAITANIPVGMTATIDKNNLKVGKKNADVARYQAALFNAVGVGMRQGWINKWKLSRGQIFDGTYGPATADLTKMVYNWLATNRPGQGWTAGATEPGAGLLKHIGFKSVK